MLGTSPSARKRECKQAHTATNTKSVRTIHLDHTREASSTTAEQSENLTVFSRNHPLVWYNIIKVKYMIPQDLLYSFNIFLDSFFFLGFHIVICIDTNLNILRKNLYFFRDKVNPARLRIINNTQTIYYVWHLFSWIIFLQIRSFK